MSEGAEQHSVFPAGYFTGEMVVWQTANAVLSEVRHTVAKSVPKHEHEAAYFSLLLEGAYTERAGDFDLLYEPYTLVVHSAHTVHQDEMIEPCRFFAVALLPEWETVITELGDARAHVFELDGGDAVWLMLKLYREFLARNGSAEDVVEPLIYELCGCSTFAGGLPRPTTRWRRSPLKPGLPTKAI